MIAGIFDFFQGLSWWQTALISGGLFVITFLVSIGVAAFIMVKIPSTFFLDSHSRDWWSHRPPWQRWTATVTKNVLGALLVIAGVIQIFTPGQGLLTILIGIVLLDFPGKRRLERKIVGRPKVLAAINALRARYGREPLVLEEPKAEPAARERHKTEVAISETRL